jgi:hypothetical protein
MKFRSANARRSGNPSAVGEKKAASELKAERKSTRLANKPSNLIIE